MAEPHPKLSLVGYTMQMTERNPRGMNTLMQALTETPLKRRLLPSYDGPCSVGVIGHPTHTGDLAVEVRLPANSTVEVAPCLEVDGQQVEVLVRHDYRPIRTLAAR